MASTVAIWNAAERDSVTYLLILLMGLQVLNFLMTPFVAFSVAYGLTAGSIRWVKDGQLHRYGRSLAVALTAVAVLTLAVNKVVLNIAVR